MNFIEPVDSLPFSPTSINVMLELQILMFWMNRTRWKLLKFEILHLNAKSLCRSTFGSCLTFDFSWFHHTAHCRTSPMPMDPFLDNFTMINAHKPSSPNLNWNKLCAKQSFKLVDFNQVLDKWIACFRVRFLTFLMNHTRPYGQRLLENF